MNEEISIEYDGKIYSAEYVVFGDALTVYLPDGSSRTIELRGLDPKGTAIGHLKGYIKLVPKLQIL